MSAGQVHITICICICICICTYRRPELLRRLLAAVQRLRTDGRFNLSVVVVDNDDRGSAREVVERASAASSVPIAYHIEPERSISLARNRSVRNADGDLIAFVDDDEFPEESWLLNHFETLRATGADGVLGPVNPHFGEQAPAWLVRSGLCERSRFETGTPITESRHTRTGNVLLRRSLFEGSDGWFDPKYGRAGGGDAVFFKRMIDKGKRFVWCDEAVVYESVAPERETRAYYVKRAFTRGMGEASETPFLSAWTLRSFAAVVLYTAALPFLFLLGQHLFMRYAVKDCDHLGKLLGYVGISVVRERPYAASSS